MVVVRHGHCSSRPVPELAMQHLLPGFKGMSTRHWGVWPQAVLAPTVFCTVILGSSLPEVVIRVIDQSLMRLEPFHCVVSQVPSRIVASRLNVCVERSSSVSAGKCLSVFESVLWGPTSAF